MKLLRTGVNGFVIALFLVIAVGDALAQRGGGGPLDRSKASNIPDPLPGEVYDVDCPNCKQKLEVRDTMSTMVCTKCGKELKVIKGNGTLSLELSESGENKWKKPLLIGGGVLLVLGLIGMVLKRTVLAPPPVKKKKKKRRDDDDDEDDRPRKKKAAVVEEDDDAPRPKKKKPIVVEDDDEDDAPPPKKKLR